MGKALTSGSVSSCSLFLWCVYLPLKALATLSHCSRLMLGISLSIPSAHTQRAFHVQSFLIVTVIDKVHVGTLPPHV